MTIAAALFCHDGLIVCADTEETISDERKCNTGKISVIEEFSSVIVPSDAKSAFNQEERHDWTIAVTGAGHSDWLVAFRQELHRDVFPRIREKPNVQTFDSLLKEHTKRFFEQYLKGYAENPEQRPQACMLIAVTFGGLHRELYRTNDDLVLKSEYQSHISVGAGAPMFQHLAHDLMKSSYNMKQTASIVTYLMSRVKADVRGCGGNTHIMMIGADGIAKSIPTRRIKELEIHHAEVELRLYKGFAAELIKELP